MQFNSLTFPIFFLVFYSAYVVLEKKNQNLLLFIANYLFYCWFDWRLSFVLFCHNAVNYFFSVYLGSKDKKAHKKLVFCLGIIFNIFLLSLFKYYHFIVDNIIFLFKTDEFYGFESFKIIFPIGISFYTFKSISYLYDTYKNSDRISADFITFSIYIAFFPQIVAGPLERASNFLPQLDSQKKINQENLIKGCMMILWGFFLKLFLADNLGPIVDSIFNKATTPNGYEVIIGSYAFAFQIYGDFAGYSSIAIGIGYLLGYTTMPNFLFPYFVTTPRQFWMNWHISLSTWLRDYLYIPLGGNRKGGLLTYRNLLLTMVFGGVWHGAAWNFVLWGGYQGIVLGLHRFISEKSKGSGQHHFSLAIKMFCMFQISCLGWLIFRANSFNQIIIFLKALIIGPYIFSAKVSYYAMTATFFIFWPLLINCLQYKYKCPNEFSTFPYPVRIISMLVVCYLLVLMGNFGTNQFIYQQF